MLIGRNLEAALPQGRLAQLADFAKSGPVSKSGYSKCI